MKKIFKFLKNNIYIIISFLIPFFILGLIYTRIGMFPFGEKSVLISDMNGQYVHFFSEYKNILINGKSLLYSWNAGMGLNLIGLITYYVSSPITFILLIIPNQYLTEGILLMTMIKIGISGCTFAIYLRYVFKKNNISILIFSLMYSLMSYSIVYTYNVMWLDGVFLLPIVLIGVEKIIKEKKYIFLTITFIILFISNFYISFMDGLFSFIYFIGIYFMQYNNSKPIDFLKKLSLYILSGILSIGCTAFLMIPAYYSLKTGESPFMNSLPGWGMNFNLFDLLSKLLVGSYDSPIDGLPNIFCGLTVVLLLPLFYTNEKIKLREKIVYTILLLIMIISSWNRNINLVWHAFHVPNCFPYRYSFIFSFIMIVISYKVYINFKYIRAKQLFKSYILIGAIIIIIQKFGYNYLNTKNYYMTFIFLTVYFLIFYLKTKYDMRYNKTISSILILTVFFEMLISSSMLLGNVNKMLGFANRNTYINYVKTYRPIFDDIQNKDKTFYRMENNFHITHNDPLSLGYNGISSFTSTANQKLNQSLNSFGFYSAASLQEMDYKGSTIITDSIFGIKYIVSNTDINDYYNTYLKKSETTVYKNPFALPIGFLVSDNLYNLKFSDNKFENQNEVLNKMLGNKNKVNYFNRITNINVKLNNVTVSNNNGTNEYTKIDSNKEASIEYSVNNMNNNPIYAYFGEGSINNLAGVYIDNKLFDGNYIHFYYKSYILEADSKQSKNSKVIKLVLNQNKILLKDQMFYYLDMNSTENALKSLNNNVLNITEHNDTLIKGNVNVDDRKLLYTSIPYDSGWSVKIDGKKSKINMTMNSFIAVDLPKGEHEIIFEFSPKGFKIGIFISISSTLIFICFIISSYIRTKKLKM